MARNRGTARFSAELPSSSPGLQRTVTGAEWDHVALVVPSAFASASLNLLESTAEGCTVYPLASRLKAYAHGFTQYMVLRRLEGAADPAALADYEKRVEAEFARSVRQNNL